MNSETDTDLTLTLSSSGQATRILPEQKQTPWLRKPTKSDAAKIHQLISECPPLDLNSVYTYLLLSEHFRHTCIVAGTEDRLLGYISAYIHPKDPNVLFVWQVAVHAQARGQRLANQMLSNLLQRKELATVNYIETTVGPDNQASRQVFRRLAAGLSAPMQESVLFPASLFGNQNHEDEPLLRIGPFMPIIKRSEK